MADKPRFGGERVKLGDVCTIVSGATPKTKTDEYWGGEIRWVTPAELDGDSHYISDTEKHLTEAGYKSASLHMMPKGTVLLTTRAPIGKVAIAAEEMSCNQGFKNLVCSSAINNEFLYLYLKSRTAELQAMGRGATFKELSKKNVAGFEINLPAIDRQLDAVARLTAVGSQIALAKQQHDQLDSLVKSRFVEMFGGALSIENKWDSSILENCVESLESGKSPSCKNVSRKGLDPGVLKLSALSSGRFLPGENKAMLDGETIIQAKEVKQGDILVARKNTPQLVGSCVLVREDVTNLMFPDIVFRMHPNDSVNGEYLAALLSSPSYSSKVRGLAHGSNKSMSNIPKSELAKLSIPLPPLSLQQEFADFVAQVDKSRFIAQQQIDKLQTLYDSLAQEYFA